MNKIINTMMITATAILLTAVMFGCGKDDDDDDPIVNAAPDITTAELPDGIFGEAYSDTLAAKGSAPITWSVEDGELPDGLELDTATGEISGTPTADGEFTFTVKAANVAGSDTRELSIIITRAPDITTAELPDGVLGEA